MSQMCPKCGALVSPVSKKCYSCGAELEAAAPKTDFFEMEEAKPLNEYKPAAPASPQAPEKPAFSADTYSSVSPSQSYQPASFNEKTFYNPAMQNDKKPMWIFSIGIIAAIIVGLLILLNSSGLPMSRADKALVKPISNALAGVVDNDFDMVMSTYPPAIKEAILQDLSLYNMTEQDFMDIFDAMFSSLGLDQSNIKFKVNLKGKEKLSQTEIDEMQASANDILESPLYIQEAYSLNIDIITKYNGKRGSENTDYIVIKIDGNWYLGDFL
ncbi:MAG: zinc ribbon domain-containing protein [Oscillospiraceae bacterium]|jgi:hypothetical protein